MFNRKLFDKFKRLGFTEYETEAYLTLLSHGSLSPSKISSTSKIPRPRVYDILKGLASRGIILEKPGKPNTYSPVEIDKVMSILESEVKDECERKLSLIEEHGKFLKKELSNERPKRIDRIFAIKNTKILVDWFRISATRAKTHIQIISTFDRCILPRAFRNYLEFAKRMKHKKVKVSYCLSVEKWNVDELKKLSKFIEIKHLPKEYRVGFYIIDGKEALIASSSYPNATYDNGILFRDNVLIKIFQEHFQRICGKSIPIDKRIKELS